MLPCRIEPLPPLLPSLLSLLCLLLLILGEGGEAGKRKDPAAEEAGNAFLLLVAGEVPPEHLQQKGDLKVVHPHLIQVQHLPQKEAIHTCELQDGLAVQ